MMRKTRYLATLVLMFSAVAVDGAERGSDISRLQGKWTAKAGPKHDVQVLIEFEGKHTRIEIATPQGLKCLVRGEVKLDEKAEPRALDWTNLVCDDGQELPEMLAIYNLGDKTFTVCNAGPGAERPTAFKDGEGALAGCVTFERAGGR
jgi:uncharacterized protein (TIGR03067 family)